MHDTAVSVLTLLVGFFESCVEGSTLELQNAPHEFPDYARAPGICLYVSYGIYICIHNL